MPIRIDRKGSQHHHLHRVADRKSRSKRNQLAQVRVEQVGSPACSIFRQILNSFEEGINVRALTSHQGKSFGIQK